MLILLDFAVIYLCDIDEVPDFNQMYELYDTMTIMFFYRNKHMMCDFGTGNNNKLNWVLEDKQELIDIIETIYKGAKKGRGLVVSPKGMLSIIAYVAQVRRLKRLQIILHDTDTKKGRIWDGVRTRHAPIAANLPIYDFMKESAGNEPAKRRNAILSLCDRCPTCAWPWGEKLMGSLHRCGMTHLEILQTKRIWLELEESTGVNTSNFCSDQTAF